MLRLRLCVNFCRAWDPRSQPPQPLELDPRSPPVWPAHDTRVHGTSPSLRNDLPDKFVCQDATTLELG